MPEISRFFGIVVRMFHDDHAPPHFHAKYGEYQAKIEIETGEVIAGKLPRRAMALVWEWWELHKVELILCWKRVVEEQRMPTRIEPLE
jgi:Domain of unknown function (DUF4160)